MTPAQPGRAVVRLKSVRAGRAVAAAAVVCVMVLSGCTAGQHSSLSVPAGTSLPRPGGMPGFYLVVAGLEVVVRASADGHVTGTAAIPVPAAGAGHAWVGGEAFGSTDGRHFVIVIGQAGGLPGVADVSLFRLTVSLDGRPGRLGRVPFDSTGEPVTGAALSPDGRMLALSLLDEFVAGPLYGSVDVINLASGATRIWTGQATPEYWPASPLGPATPRSPSPGGTTPPGIRSRPSSPESATSISRRQATTWPQRRWPPSAAPCRSRSPR
jgi:hypothetical protein